MTPVGWRRMLLGGLALGAVTGVCWVIGLSGPTALLVALVLVALFGLRQGPAADPDQDWPAIRDDDPDHGVRREVTRLSWSLHGHESRVERRSLHQLRAVAERRLALHGRRLSDPADVQACRDLLGPPAYRVITAAETRTEITFDEFAAAVAALQQQTEPNGRAA